MAAKGSSWKVEFSKTFCTFIFSLLSAVFLFLCVRIRRSKMGCKILSGFVGREANSSMDC